MKIRSVKVMYICPVCGNKREIHIFKDDPNLNDLCTDHKGCIVCAAGHTVSALDVLNVECNVRRSHRCA